jgi:hypothetical protein
MCLLGDPVYHLLKVLVSDKEIKKFLSNSKNIFSNYVIIKAKFEFPKNIKYPSIPCYLDGTTTVYPLKGKSLLTGPEYLLAKKQGCIIDIEYLILIPFSKEVKDGVEIFNNKPFEKIVRELQDARRRYPKGTINNLIYKEIGNSIYGNVVKGMSNKKMFDIKTKTMIPASSNQLSNPILGSYITSLTRCLLGECLHNIAKMGGKVVSSTTDGFITNLESLENKLLGLPLIDIEILNIFRDIRMDLSGNPEVLEVKQSGKGVIS